MLTAFFEIIMALLTVYGLYCLMIDVFYTIFCKNKGNICIGIFAKEKKPYVSDLLLAKKVFLGRTRTVILIDCDTEELKTDEIIKNNESMEIYRAERVKRS